MKLKVKCLNCNKYMNTGIVENCYYCNNCKTMVKIELYEVKI